MTFNLPKFIFENYPNLPNQNISNVKSFYASDSGKCSRDLYWAFTGEPYTDKTDMVGLLRMKFSDAIEKCFASEVMAKLSIFGLHLLAQEVRVNGTDPDWFGREDQVFAYQDETGKFVPVDLEFKCVWGLGAQILYEKFDPKTDHVGQIGLYLKSRYLAGKPREGKLLYFLATDDKRLFAHLVCFNCRYNPDTDNIEIYSVHTSLGDDKALDIKRRIGEITEKWDRVKKAVEAKECPKPDYVYKKPLTPQGLQAKDGDRYVISDAALKGCIEGTKLIGDWQPVYSPYKTKILETDKITPFYTPDEVKMFENEYKRRHPHSKKY